MRLSFIYDTFIFNIMLMIGIMGITYTIKQSFTLTDILIQPKGFEYYLLIQIDDNVYVALTC